MLDEKIARLIKEVDCIDDITVHTVSPEWCRRYVDMDYMGNDSVEIIEVSYTPECYAMPNRLMLTEFMGKSISELKDLLEI